MYTQKYKVMEFCGVSNYFGNRSAAEDTLCK